MEFEQITKRLEWLDDQERKSKASVSEIGKSLTTLETTVNAISKQLKTLTKEVSDLGPAAARLNQFDQILAKQRAELNKAFEDIEKNAQRREREAIKQRQIELKEINASRLMNCAPKSIFNPSKNNLKTRRWKINACRLPFRISNKKLMRHLSKSKRG